MLIEQIVERMQKEWTLINRGTGWYLSEKKVPYRSQRMELIDSSVVDAMEVQGIITIDIPYISAIASLTEHRGIK